ncbi:insulinase family protein [Litorilituus lipolyticus]|uniref:Protease 3 n=1 Tax=Litorilituus lipolyticus TaxID=2491017 RepID=A0A502L2D0_9GAMM|nr:insulinase family protein [Litorilituus lipolyticus]TPH18022.1 hypothetical protein EPA86_02585 [Litorilituus lipolyticus]
MFTKPIKRYALSIAIFTATALVGHHSNVYAESTETENIIVTSQYDSKDYLHFILDNGLKALVISDKTSEVAAASLVVGVGHRENPKAYLGLAHLLEHAVFWGSKNFPNTNEFDPFVKSNQGWSNASTRTSNTRYHFQVTQPAFDETLHRMADFLAYPLLTESSIRKSLIAVDNEFNGRINDWRKTALILQNETNPKHPSAKFGTGNTQTLSTDTKTLKKALSDFHRQYYGAQNMTLVLYGKQSTQALKTLAIKHFDQFPQSELSSQPSNEPLHLSNQLASKIEVLSPSSNPSIDLRFELPANASDFPHNTQEILFYLLGHESEGSLFTYLKTQGLINYLQVIDQGSRYVGKLHLYLELTDKGVKDQDKVIAAVFSYIDLLKKTELPPWIVAELQVMAQRQFDFPKSQEPGDWISPISDDMHLYLAKHWLNNRTQISIENFNHFLSYLTPENMQLIVSHTNKDDMPNTNKIEPIFNTPYKTSTLTTEQLNSWSNATKKSSMHLPKANPYLAQQVNNQKNHQLLLKDKTTKLVQIKPELVINKQGIQLWVQHKTDLSRNKISTSLRLYHEIKSQNPIVKQIYANMVQEQLHNSGYFASLAGFSTNINTLDSHYVIDINGYKENYFDYAEKVLTTFFTLEPSKLAFASAKQRIKGNITHRKSQDHAHQQLERVLYKDLFNELSDAQTLEALKNFSYQDYVTALNTDQQFQLNGVIAGDVNAMAVQEFAKSIISTQAIKLASDLSTTPNVKKLANTRHQSEIPLAHDDASINYLIQSQDNSFKSQAMFHLTQSLLSREYYYSIRDTKSLAYFVDLNKLYSPASSGIVMSAQSSNSSAEALINASNDFLIDYANKLTEMSEADFQQKLQLSLNKLNAPSFHLDRYTKALSTELYANGQITNYRFDQKEKIALVLSNISKESFEQFYQQQIVGKNSKRWLLFSKGKLKT